MNEYFIGIVKKYYDDRIIFECNNHGFILQGVNLHLLAFNQTIKLYIYFYQRLPISQYFAFLDQETKQYFLELISINYIGPKIALKILNYFSIKEFENFISNSDIESFKKIKGITNRLALAIIKHFKNKNNFHYLKSNNFE